MTKVVLHQLIDEVRERDMGRAAEFLRALNHGDHLGMRLAIADEVKPEPDEIEAIAAVTEDDVRNGIPLEKVMAELGLTTEDLR